NITVLVLDLRPDGGETRTPEAGPGSGGSGRLGKRYLRLAGLIVVALAVLAAVVVGASVYIDRQWYVGEADGKVAVYQGIPASFLGVHLSHTVEIEGDLPAPSAQTLTLYTDLPSGITASSRAEAEGIVQQIRTDVRVERSSGSDA